MSDRTRFVRILASDCCCCCCCVLEEHRRRRSKEQSATPAVSERSNERERERRGTLSHLLDDDARVRGGHVVLLELDRVENVRVHSHAFQTARLARRGERVGLLENVLGAGEEQLLAVRRRVGLRRRGGVQRGELLFALRVAMLLLRSEGQWRGGTSVGEKKTVGQNPPAEGRTNFLGQTTRAIGQGMVNTRRHFLVVNDEIGQTGGETALGRRTTKLSSHRRERRLKDFRRDHRRRAAQVRRGERLRRRWTAFEGGVGETRTKSRAIEWRRRETNGFRSQVVDDQLVVGLVVEGRTGRFVDRREAFIVLGQSGENPSLLVALEKISPIVDVTQRNHRTGRLVVLRPLLFLLSSQLLQFFFVLLGDRQTRAEQRGIVDLLLQLMEDKHLDGTEEKVVLLPDAN